MKHIKKNLFLFFFASILVNNSALASNVPNGKLDFHSEYATLELQKLTINEDVVEIPSGEFAGCTKFTSLVVPNSVTKINARSFEYCENLEEVYLPDSLQEIGDSTFEGCFNLKHISLPQSLEAIYTGAFKLCSTLEYIHLPTSLNVIGNESFYGCERLLELKVPNRTTYIGNNCLAGCTSLKSLILPNSVTILENMLGETKNTDLNVLINDFDGDTNLTHNRLTGYGIQEDSIENACENGNTLEVIINAQIDLDDEDIQDSLSQAKVLNVYTENVPDNFYGQMIDAKITNFNEGVKAIGHNVLVNPLSIDDEDTYGPVEIILPDTLESIGGNSIYGWQNLRFVSLGENISEIGYNVFASCENLRIIEIRAVDEGNFEVIKTLLMLAGISENKIRWRKK